MQHWDMVALSGCDYFRGQITKYLSRWRFKNGIQDLEKSAHYAEKMSELVSESRVIVRSLALEPVREFLLLNDFTLQERRLMFALLSAGGPETALKACNDIRYFASETTSAMPERGYVDQDR